MKQCTPESIAKKHDVSVDVINKQLEIGTEVEKEHTDSDEEAMKIALDHLEEIPDYYTRLIAMEKEAEKDMNESAMLESLLSEKEVLHGDYSIRSHGIGRASKYEGAPKHVAATNKAVATHKLSTHYDSSSSLSGSKYGPNHVVSVTNKKTGETSQHHVYRAGDAVKVGRHLRPNLSVRSTDDGRKDMRVGNKHNDVLANYLQGKKPVKESTQDMNESAMLESLLSEKEVLHGDYSIRSHGYRSIIGFRRCAETRCCNKQSCCNS